MNWIKVSDKLPKENQEILFIFKEEIIIGKEIKSKNLIKFGNFFENYFESYFEFDYINEYDQCNVTHWMPLPELPRDLK